MGPPVGVGSSFRPPFVDFFIVEPIVWLMLPAIDNEGPPIVGFVSGVAEIVMLFV